MKFSRIKLFNKPEWIFLFFSLFFGISLIFLTPPMQVPDELNHFLRAFQVSKGNFLPKKVDQKLGEYLPQEILTAFSPYHAIPFHADIKTDRQTILESQQVRITPTPPVFIPFSNTAIFPPVSYFPQAFGIVLGETFSRSPLTYFYLGRLLNLLVWILLIFCSIHLTPIFKWVFFVLALLPMSIFISSSCSADVLTNGLSFFLISVFLDATSETPQLKSKWALSLMFVIALLLSLVKSFYLLISLLFFIIPFRKWGGIKRSLRLFLLIFTLPLLLQGWWLTLAKKYFVPTHTDIDISISDQLQYVLQQPLTFIKIFFQFLYKSGWEIISELVGNLGWLDTPIPQWLVISLCLSLIMIALLEKREDFSLNFSQKVLSLSTFGLVFFLVIFSQYLYWSKVRGDLIEGPQGRYFLPVASLFLIGFYNNKFYFPNFQKKFLPGYVTCLCFVSLITTLYVVCHRYYH